MASRRKRKQDIEIAIEHMTTSHAIKSSYMCSECPYRIFCEDDDKVTFGTGNIYGEYIFVLPTYDSKAKANYITIVSKLIDVYKDITGRDILQDGYVTRIVKCHTVTSHDLYDAGAKACIKYLHYEFTKIHAPKVIFFGSAYTDFVEYKTSEMVYNNKRAFEVYSPGIFFYEDNAKMVDKFTTDLLNALNC